MKNVFAFNTSSTLDLFAKRTISDNGLYGFSPGASAEFSVSTLEVISLTTGGVAYPALVMSSLLREGSTVPRTT